MHRVLLLVTLFTLSLNGSAQQSSTTVPNLIRYGGVLKNVQGAAMASRTVGITFLIYGQQEGGAPVWLETQNIATDGAGQYSVLLGNTSASGLPGDLFAQQEQRWLAVKAEGQPEQPRVLLVSVPYAMKAAVADTLSGHSASEFVTTDNLQSAVQQLQGQATTVAPGTAVGTNSKSTAAGNPPVPTNTATNFVDNTANQIVLVQQNGTGIGLKASSPNNVGVLGTVSSSPKAGISAGVEGTSSINNGYGLFGYSTAASVGIGAQGRSDSANGIGVRGFTIGASGVAVSALSNATSGSPVGLLSSISAPGGTGAQITNAAAGTVTGPLINATTIAGTQFTVAGNGNVSATGTVTGTRLISTATTGTAPLQVASTALVPNLNASLLGGNAASAFASANGSPSYIWNGTAVQPGANLNISGNGSIGGNLSVQGSGSFTGLVTFSPNQTFPGTSVNGAFGPVSPMQIALKRWYTANQSASFPIGCCLEAATFDGESLWVTGGPKGLVKMRISDGAVLLNFFVTQNPQGIAFDGQNIWIAETGLNKIFKVQASDGTILGSFPTGSNPLGVAFDGSSIWVANNQDSTVSKFNPTNGTIQGVFTVSQFPNHIAFDGANIWVACNGGITKLRASDGSLLGTFLQGSGAWNLLFDGSNIWTISGMALTKIRSSDGSIESVVTASPGKIYTPENLAFDGTNIWVVNFASGTGNGFVSKFLATDSSFLGTFSTNTSPIDIVFDGANIWEINSFGSVSKL